MIDETHVRQLHDAAHESAALVLLEGRAQVVDSPSGQEEGAEGALLLITKHDLVSRVGEAPTDHELRDLAYALDDMAAKLGA